MIPYGRQYIDEDDERAVLDVLHSPWLTTGPMVGAFEEGICDYIGVGHAVAVSSGTAALHAAYHAMGIGPGDEVIVPAMTFAATANAVLYCGGIPVFADSLDDNLTIDTAHVESLITSRTKCVVGVDYAGHPCDWLALRTIADKHSLALLADGCHALGATLGGKMVGTLADVTVFSFHPVKHLATGEGGMCVTNDEEMARKMRVFRNHGIETDARERSKTGAWFYEMTELGFNYRITDIQCALGLSQLGKMSRFIAARRAAAAQYDKAFQTTAVRPLSVGTTIEHAYHLYVVRVPDRDRVYKEMQAGGVGVNVHYIPVHLHPYYRDHLSTTPGLCPVAEKAYSNILSLPMWYGVQPHLETVVTLLTKACQG